MSLNQAQREAIAHKDGPCLVLAGPGSGKTLTIVKRIEYLIEKQGVRPEEILVITFTKYAAGEMKQRFYEMMGKERPPVTFGTFHGVYYGILKWAYGFGPENLLSEEEKYQMIRQVAAGKDIEIIDEKDFIQDISTEIGTVKNSLAKIDAYESLKCPAHIFREIYIEYEQRRKQARKIDFDDMLVLCYELFLKRPDILAKWQGRFSYILVDEFQDINQVQYDVLRMLARPQDNLFVVGDDDQSIYRFRGADAQIMLNFQKEYSHSRQLLLDVNYRSTENIVKNALKVISNNQGRFPKHIKACKSSGKNLHVQEVMESAEESQYILKEVKERVKKGIPLERMAVLFRIHGDARTLTEALIAHNIPFQMKEYIPNIYEHFIGQNIKTYFKMALGSRLRQDFLNIMNRPKRYIGRDSLEGAEVSFEDLREFYCDKEWMLDRIDQFELDLRMIVRMAPFAAIQYIRKHIGYDEFLKEYAEFRHISVEELFDVLHEIETQSKAYQTLEEWMEHVAEYTAVLKASMKARRDKKDGIHLLTMHGAKGLEFDTVFIIEANEGVIPYRKAKLDCELEEERRLFYVAMTRAKEELIITYVKTKNGKETAPSRFVNELFVDL